MNPSSVRPFLLVAAVLALSTGCASLTPRVPHVAGVADTIFYASARARVNGHDTHQFGSALEYGIAVVQRHARTPDDGGLAHDIVDSTRLDSLAFVSLLRTQLARHDAPFDFAVLYVHGMGTSLHEAWQHTATARSHGLRPIPWIVFCWPSIGRGITWPTGDAVFTAAYHRDSVMADSARHWFAGAVATTREAVPSGQLVLASHSLGAQVVSETLRRDSSTSAALRRAPLRAMAFLMPDMEASWFRDSVAPALPAVSRRGVVYVSRRDRVLALARMIHDDERTGLRSNDTASLPDRRSVETVDVTNAATDEGWFQRRFGTHHALKRQTGLLFDLVNIVGTDRSPSCRERIGTATRDALGVFMLQRVMVPLEAPIHCAAHVPGARP